MSIIDLLLFMGECGSRFKRSEIEHLIEYLSKMAEDGRVITIHEDGKLSGLLTFSICDDFEPYCAHPSWDFISHDPLGHKIFIEIMLAKKWSKKIRNLFEDKLTDKYPNLEECIWLRGKRLIKVRVKRRKYAKS